MVGFDTLEPWLLGVVSTVLLLLDQNSNELVTPVKHIDEPRRDLETRRRRLVQWSLRPAFAKAAKSTPPVVEYEDVAGAYNYNLAKLDSAETWFNLFEEYVRHMRISVKLAAISLIPAAGYTTALALNAAPDSAGIWVIGGSSLMFAAFGSVAIYTWTQFSRSRREFDTLVRDVDSALSTIQTLLASGGE